MDTLNDRKIDVDKLAVFDLDDTLYISNSHIEILCKFYNNEFCKSWMFKVIGKVLPLLQRWGMYYFYNRIPSEYKKNFILPFNKNVINLLEKKRLEGFHTIIISNAPLELIENAAKELKLNYIQAKPYKKASVLKDKYHIIQEIFVCTDNKSDIDILKVADSAVITCKHKNIDFFKERLKGRNFEFLIGD